jgi:hypothetical protein
MVASPIRYVPIMTQGNCNASPIERHRHSPPFDLSPPIIMNRRFAPTITHLRISGSDETIGIDAQTSIDIHMHPSMSRAMHLTPIVCHRQVFFNLRACHGHLDQ